MKKDNAALARLYVDLLSTLRGVPFVSPTGTRAFSEVIRRHHRSPETIPDGYYPTARAFVRLCDLADESLGTSFRAAYEKERATKRPRNERRYKKKWLAALCVAQRPRTNGQIIADLRAALWRVCEVPKEDPEVDQYHLHHPEEQLDAWVYAESQVVPGPMLWAYDVEAAIQVYAEWLSRVAGRIPEDVFPEHKARPKIRSALFHALSEPETFTSDRIAWRSKNQPG